MKLCPKCSSKYGEELHFCPKDGTALTRQRDEPAFVRNGMAVSGEDFTQRATTRQAPTCSACGSGVAADQTFCRHCGRKLPPRPSTAISPEITAKIDAVRQQLAADSSKALAMPEFGEVEQHLLAIRKTEGSGDAATLLARIEEARGDVAKERGDFVEALARYRNGAEYDPGNVSLISKLAAVASARVEQSRKHRQALYASLRSKALLPGIFSALVLVGYFFYEPLVNSLAQRTEKPAAEPTPLQPSALEPGGSHGPDSKSGSMPVAASTRARGATATTPAGHTAPAASSTAIHGEEVRQAAATPAPLAPPQHRSGTSRAAEEQASISASTSTAREATTPGQTPAFEEGSAPAHPTPNRQQVEPPQVASVPRAVPSSDHAEPEAAEGWYDVVYGTTLLSEPHEDAPVITTLRRGRRLHVVAAAGRFLRVESTTGRPPGFVARDQVSHLVSEEDTVAGWYEVVSRTPVLTEPHEDASVITHLGSGSKVHVIAARGAFLKVESFTGRPSGFVARDQVSRLSTSDAR
jgi:hypothetical protein